MVTREYEIIELLVKVSLYASKLNGECLCHQLEKTIVEGINRDLVDWTTSHQPIKEHWTLYTRARQ